jgi:hypothetical protein
MKELLYKKIPMKKNTDLRENLFSLRRGQDV